MIFFSYNKLLSDYVCGDLFGNLCENWNFPLSSGRSRSHWSILVLVSWITMTYISSLYNFNTKTIDRKTSTWSGPFSLPVIFSSDSHKIVSNELCHYVASFRFVVLETNLLALYCLHIYFYLFMWMFTTCYLYVICDTKSFHPYLLLGAFRNVSFYVNLFFN